MKKLILFLTFPLLASATAVAEDSDNDYKDKYAGMGYSLVWHDEFDGDAVDFNNWSYCSRRTATWNMRNSSREELYLLEDGNLVLRAMANDDTENDPVPFITSALESKGKFDFTYGIVEARLKTTPHKGNFPAFWMMPTVNPAGWPYGGEIDIWEQIDNDTYNYHTLHGYWTNISGGRYSTSNFNPAEYQVFSLKWEPEAITWYVNGTKVHQVKKSATDTHEYAWPFTNHFYIILDQAVGDDNSWPQHFDPDFVYATYFDWVRVYQREGETNSLQGAVDSVSLRDVEVKVVPEGLLVYSEEAVDVPVYDLAGRLVAMPRVKGEHREPLQSGCYSIAGRKYLIPGQAFH